MDGQKAILKALSKLLKSTSVAAPIADALSDAPLLQQLNTGNSAAKELANVFLELHQKEAAEVVRNHLAHVAYVIFPRLTFSLMGTKNKWSFFCHLETSQDITNNYIRMDM